MPPTRQPTCKPAGGEEGRLKNLAGGARAETEERWSGQEFLGQEKGKFSSKSPDFNHLCAVDWRWKNQEPVFSRVKRDWTVSRKIVNFWEERESGSSWI